MTISHNMLKCVDQERSAAALTPADAVNPPGYRAVDVLHEASVLKYVKQSSDSLRTCWRPLVAAAPRPVAQTAGTATLRRRRVLP
jgi:hypothetical protein